MSDTEKFSGWRVLLGCILCMFTVQGAMQTFAVFLPQIVQGTGWSLSMVAQVSTFASGSGFITNLLLTRALKRLRVKTVLLIGAVCTALHMFIYTASQSVYMLWLAAFIGGIGIGWGTVAPCSIIITNWFVKHRSLCIAAATAGSMLGSVVLNPTAAMLIERFGWRGAYRILGIAVGLASVLSVLLLVREKPQELGQRPYGIGHSEESSPAALHGVSAERARRSASYWLLLPGIFLIGFSTNIENYMPAFWQYRGLSSMNSSLVLSFYSLFAAVISLVMSRINDRLGGKRYVLATSLLFALSVLVMTYTGVTGAIFSLVICCIPFAAGAKKACTMTPPLVVAEAFGRKDYSNIIGPFAAVLQMGIALSNLAIGPLAEISYELAFTCMTGVNIAGMLCICLALRLRPAHGE